jgi:carboxymethylenebutenolidase
MARGVCILAVRQVTAFMLIPFSLDMKKQFSLSFYLVAVLLLAAGPLFAQKQKAKQEKDCGTSCCAAMASGASNPNVQFASLASKKEFRRAHMLPRPFTLANPIGKMVTIPVAGGAPANAYEIKAEGNSNLYLLVFQEWWGLNDHIKAEAERLYNELGKKVNVWALDMYDGKIATTREDAGKYMQGADQARLQAITKAAVAAAGANAKIGTIGWCFGGGLSMQASLAAGKQGVACVIYYGMPELDAAKLAALNAPVLNIWPKQDKWINEDMKNKFEAAMKVAGKNLRTEAYEADHAFCNPSNPKHDKKLTDDANGKAVAFLKEHLK